jgi:hypothetical protein
MTADEPSPAADAAVARTVLRNEFALVEVSVVDTGNGRALRVRDAESGRVIVLDPLELEALTRLDHADFGRLVVHEGDLSGRCQEIPQSTAAGD